MVPSSLRVSAFSIPTQTPEADGTLAWDKTVLVTTEVRAEGVVGFGYTYADESTAHFICEHLAPLVLASDPSEPTAMFAKMGVAVRNVGRGGVGATAIAAVDMALWDLKARSHHSTLASLLGSVRGAVDAYASGGFTSYSDDELRAHFERYAGEGFRQVKMKIGDDARTEARVRLARSSLGESIALFVDANGAFTPKRALGVAEALREANVRWFEEPCSSDDLDGLRFVRERTPCGMDVAAGEYGYTAQGLGRMLDAHAVDVLQADATRCGVTGFMQVVALCAARGTPLSAHCAPTVHAHLGCASPPLVHVEYFYDHVRIESLLFEGYGRARQGQLAFDPTAPGLGVQLKRRDAERYSVFDREMGAPRS